MGTHLIPREIDGDARILLIFTPKGFFGLLIALIPGLILQVIISLLGAKALSYIVLAICGIIGFAIGQLKMPESRSVDLFRKTGGLYIRDVIRYYFTFKKNRKYYVYDIDAVKKEEEQSQKD